MGFPDSLSQIWTTRPVYGRLKPMKLEFEQIFFSEKQVQETVERFEDYLQSPEHYLG